MWLHELTEGKIKHRDGRSNCPAGPPGTLHPLPCAAPGRAHPAKGKAMRTLRYWRRVVGYALSNTQLVLGQNPKKSGVGIIVTWLAIGFFAAFEGGPQAWPKVEWWLSCLAAISTIFVAVFAYQFINAPPRLEDAAQQESLAMGDSLRATVEEFKATVNKTSEEYSRALKQVSAELESARGANPQRNAIRRQVEYYIGKFEEIVAALESGDQGARQALHMMDSAAYKYLQTNLPQYGLYHSDSGIERPMIRPPWPEVEKLKYRAKVALARLREVMAII